MSSRVRIQTYLKRNRVSELFEDLMSKLVQDLPSDPVEYLIQILQRKSSVLHKKSPSKDIDLKVRTSKATSQSASLWSGQEPNHPKAEKLSSTINVTETDASNDSNRQYSKPWLTHSKKQKPSSKEKLSRPGLSHTLPTTVKPEWDDHVKVRHNSDQPRLGKDVSDGEDVDLRLMYTSPKIYGKPREYGDDNEQELRCEDAGVAKKAVETRSKRTSLSQAKRNRQKEMSKRIAIAKEKTAVKSSEVDSENDDDALELYEDVNDLYSEGVKNPPKSGVYTSGNISHRKEEIELVLNMSKFFDSLGGAVDVVDGVNKPESVVTMDNDDFESASQVTGPRHPVWEAPDSEVDSVVSQTRPISARRGNAAMFDVRSLTTESRKTEIKATDPVKGDGSTFKVAGKTKGKSRSQLSGVSNRSLEVRRSSSKSDGRPQSASKSNRGSPVIKSSLDGRERPKTSQ